MRFKGRHTWHLAIKIFMADPSFSHMPRSKTWQNSLKVDIASATVHKNNGQFFHAALSTFSHILCQINLVTFQFLLM